MANDYVQTVANMLIEQLRQGTAPWQKPWDATGIRSMPYNPTSGNDYRGMNAIWLLMMQQTRGYDDARWMTFRQTSGLGGQVRRGEKGTQVQYWKFVDERPIRDEQGRPVLDEQGKPRIARVELDRPRVFTATVFNAAQIDGLPPPALRPQPAAWERDQRAEAILTNSGVDIRHQAGDRAYYHPGADHIVLPARGQFPTSADFYGVALHELGHATGHATRLNRDLSHPFGSEGYAREELRVEIASLMIADQLGIPHRPDRHAAYVASWIKLLESDPREIFRAAADAEKISRMVQGFEQQQVQAVTPAARALQRSDETAVATPVPTDHNEVAMQSSTERVYLAVPYPERHDAKALGVKWDRAAKAWYAPPGADLAPLSRWLPRAMPTEPAIDPRLAFKEALQDAGLIIDGLPQMDGELVRVKAQGDKGAERSGSYVGHLDGRPAGYINNFRTGHAASWRAPGVVAQALSAQARAQQVAEVAARRAQRERERVETQESVGQAIEQLWSHAAPATTDHPYLQKKGVEAYGVRVDAAGGLALPPGAPADEQQLFSRAGSLLVPLCDMDGRIWSVQAIDATGFKSLPKGGRYAGLHHMIGDPQSGAMLLVAEGYATAAELHRATGLPVAVAFSSNNIEVVAAAFRERFPDRPMAIAGDNDHRKPLEPDPQGRPKPNVGREKAEAAAAAVGAHALLPMFEREDQGSDWNDLRALKGQAAFEAQLRAGLAAAHRHHLAYQHSAAREGAVVALAQEPRLVQERASNQLDEGREQPKRLRRRSS